jgi:glycosyltransferase involved in cell wall biosynthesis
VSPDLPVPQWIEDAWAGQGHPRVKGSEAFKPEACALLWFINNWYSLRKPYRFGLPAELLEWLNATDLDLTPVLLHRPALQGWVSCGALKPISRFMRSLWETRGRAPSPTAEEFYDFLAEFAFAILPGLNAPQALLPAQLVELLNLPAEGDDLPLTVGMLLFLKRTTPREFRQLHEQGRNRILALSFQALDGLLAIGDPRLIPAAVSTFWSRRILPGGLITAFEYVASRAANGFGINGSALLDQANEKGIRNWFHGGPALTNRGAVLFSGPPADLAAAAGPVMRIEDRAIVIYRDRVTVAGLSRAGASMVSAFQGSGLAVYDLHFSLRRERLEMESAGNRALSINARRKLHLLNLNPEYVPECYYCNLNRFGPDDYVVGHFFWELSMVSRSHESGIAMVDEIWTASRYLTRLYETATNKPVFTMGLAISSRQVPALKPGEFGFSENAYLFLASFDAGSIVERKNPLGAVSAFQKAFPRGNEPVGLIIKTRNLEHLQTKKDTVHWERAMELMRRDSRIRVVQHTMTDEELSALYSMCSCFVSLHRSEGFGLGPAEAMAQGKPVIVTNYSGVCDFCSPATAKLVGYELVRVGPDEYPFLDPDRIYEWADPDIDAAAEHMRRLAEDREHGAGLGRAARALMLREYSVEAVLARYRARIERLGFGLSADSGA